MPFFDPTASLRVDDSRKGAQMHEIPQSTEDGPGSTADERSRRSRFAVPFAVGAMAGATVIGGVALVAHDGGPNSADAVATASPGTGIALNTTLSAEQIYRLDS